MERINSLHDGKAWQSQHRGRGRGRQFNHHLSTIPTTPPPVNVVREDEHSVSVSVNVNVNGNASVNGNVKDSKAWQSQPGDRGWGRCRPCNHHPSTSPATPPPVNDVGDEHSVSVNVNGNVNFGKSGSIIKNGSKTWPQKSDENEKKTDSTRTSEPTHETETETEREPFDICPPKQCLVVKLKPTLLAMNRERRKEMKKYSGIILRPGMILLKSYISLSDQVKIVKKCRELGMGRGGFYQPSHPNGAKNHLMMMCLGINWDPQINKYGQQHPYDGSLPPQIPNEFHQFIHAAIRDSHSLIQQHSKTPNSNPHHILPDISADICIVNFYPHSGRLGLHQDKEESEKSIRAGIPIVSFSIGDSAEFLYGDVRDVDMAKNVLLESGDVLIFGGKSRNIFHGVATIRPMTAPQLLLQETNLRPGRLNLTFRQY